MAKITRKLDIKKPEKTPPFVMPEPNDDAAAFGWSLDRLRYPSKDSTKTDIWPGRGVFEIAEAEEFRKTYGFNIEFVNPKFVQVMLDTSPDVRAAAEKCAKAGYTPKALKALRAVIYKEFTAVIVPEMIDRFQKVAGMVAEFYAARLAHIQTFGYGDEAADA